MRLLKTLFHPDGTTEVKVSVNTSEDLWHLYNFVLVGDAVRTKTKRKITKESSMGSNTSEIKVLTLEIRVNKVEFTPEEIRVHGTNLSESEHVKLGAHHTLSIQALLPQEVTIIKKEWDTIWKERLNDACDQEASADTVALLLSYGEAQLLVVTPSFIHVKTKINVTISKKHKNDGTARDKSVQKFFRQVLDALLGNVDFEKIKLLLFCSPGHVREEFLNYVRNTCQHSEQVSMKTMFRNLSKIVLIKINSCTVGSLREVFKDPTVVKQMQLTRCVKDIATWDTFQDTINKDPDRCVYTLQPVYHAALAGAISTLMISDAVFRSPDPLVRRLFLSLYHCVQTSRAAEVRIFSSNHVTGEQLTHMGNVAAILFFACPELDDIKADENFIHTEEVAEFIRKNAPNKVTVS
ncbi:unnamed protein product [Phytomonas sp. Hart1]|nr:unnamed protein product [Phytomonas sp. Hart1]|eukprot:CCW70224.1 unnamed protein product [Phytomonas sp. isolate Hart1]